MAISRILLTTGLLAALSSAMPGRGGDVLGFGTPQSVGMLAEPLHTMVGNLTNFTHAANYGSHSYHAVHPIEPGGVTIVGRDSKVVSYFAIGKRNLYADANGTLLPAHLQEDATLDTVYDMASLTKMFTTVAALRAMDAGLIALDAPVASYVPAFAANDTEKASVTIEMLMTHTSGFDADPSPALYSGAYATHADKIDAIVTQRLLNAPGSTFLYSDLNFMNLMVVLETVTGRPLDALIGDYTRELGMASTFFNRGNREGWSNPFYGRAATQEFQIAVLGAGEPQRPQPVRGTVHDENAWALGGVSGHAGLFSTALDTAKLCQMILNNGTYGGRRILSQQSVDHIFKNYNAYLGDVDADHGLGFELDQYYTAGPLASLQTASHTGFTGTSLVIDRAHNVFYVHLANRVHPSRAWSSNNIVRETLGYWVGESLGLDLTVPE